MILPWLLGALLGGCAPDPTPPPASLQAHDGQTLRCLDFEIDGNVAPEAVARALRITPGQPFDSAAWQADLQTLLNLGIFRRLDTEVVSADATGVALRLHVRTSWSLLPYLGYEGGPTPTYIIGASYGDALGQLLDVGGYYMRRGPYNLGRLWLILPHALAPRSTLDVELVMSGDTLERYPGGIELIRRGAYADVGFQLVPDRLTLALRYGFFREARVALPNLEASRQDEARLQRGARSDANLSLVAMTALIGQVDLVDNYLFRGHELRGVVVGSTGILGSSRDFALFYGAYRGFLPVLPRLDIALRGVAAYSTSPDTVDDWNLGGYNLEPFVYGSRLPGLMTVRGLRSGEGHGKQLALANLEPRFTLLDAQPLPLAGDIGLQLAAFVDVGRAGPHLSRADDVLVAGGGLLLTLLDFRYTYLHWYVARIVTPEPRTVLNVVFTRPFF